jgi:hypothetical protein
MARRPLPTPPSGPRPNPYDYRPDGYPFSGPSFAPYSYPQTPQLPTTLPGGTLLHKGFYDLLAMIPTPSPSRLIWGAPAAEEPGLAGPRYEEIRPAAPPASGPPGRQISPQTSPAPARKARRISKDMVSRPTGFVFVLLSIPINSTSQYVLGTSYMLLMLTSLKPCSIGGVRTEWANWEVGFEHRATLGCSPPTPRSPLGKPH